MNASRLSVRVSSAGAGLKLAGMSVHGTTASPCCGGGNTRVNAFSIVNDANPAAPFTTSRRDIGSDMTHLEASVGGNDASQRYVMARGQRSEGVVVSQRCTYCMRMNASL